MRTIRVMHRRESDSWVAESPDVERWTAVAGSYEEARHMAEEGVRFALDRGDVVVEHYLAESAVLVPTS